MNRSTISGRNRLLSLVVASLALVCVLALADTAAACPSCKAALANQEGRGDLVSGFFYSILFMLSMPFAIFGSFSGYFYYLVRRARQQQAENPVANPVSTDQREQQ